VVLPTALGFAWNKGYIQQIGQQLKPMLTGQKDKASVQIPAPVKKEQAQPTAK